MSDVGTDTRASTSRSHPSARRTELLALDDALERLAAIDPRKSQVVKPLDRRVEAVDRLRSSGWQIETSFHCKKWL
jgi:hypothetical protein